MANVYEIVTEKIIEKLNQGVIPWRRPWNAPAARNWQSGKEYNGINRLLLDCGEYVTFKQCAEAGGKVKKGEKSHIAVFFKWYEKENEEGEAEKWPVLRYYNVFEINQCEGLTSKATDYVPLDFSPIEAAEDILAAYKDKPDIRHEEPRAYYVPSQDYVNMPQKERFASIEDYYSTLFHELTHSTGHAKRLNRKGAAEASRFGSAAYSREELVAEMGAAMLCGVAHIENATLDNSAAYIDSWKRALKADCHLVVTAAQQAQKAADYIRGIKRDND